MKKILPIMLLTAGAFAMTSCSDFLSRSPYDEISSEEFWKSEKDLELYATGFIQRMIPAESTITRGDANTDMCALSLATDLLRPDAVVSADNQTGWSENDWINLRRINYMLDNMSKCKGVVSDEVYNHYEGVARFWRAWFYYGKIRTFGSGGLFGKGFGNATQALSGFVPEVSVKVPGCMRSVSRLFRCRLLICGNG